MVQLDRKQILEFIEVAKKLESTIEIESWSGVALEYLEASGVDTVFAFRSQYFTDAQLELARRVGYLKTLLAKQSKADTTYNQASLQGHGNIRL